MSLLTTVFQMPLFSNFSHILIELSISHYLSRFRLDYHQEFSFSTLSRYHDFFLHLPVAKLATTGRCDVSRTKGRLSEEHRAFRVFNHRVTGSRISSPAGAISFYSARERCA